MNTTTVVTTKTKVRNSFSSYYQKARDGSFVYISDRGKVGVAIVPISLLPQTKRSISICESPAYGMFRDIKNPVSFVRKLRGERAKRQYGRRSSS
ncbi:MAG: hypothetical protein ABII16_03150 [Patescibacteria group bacterium]